MASLEKCHHALLDCNKMPGWRRGFNDGFAGSAKACFRTESIVGVWRRGIECCFARDANLIDGAKNQESERKNWVR